MNGRRTNRREFLRRSALSLGFLACPAVLRGGVQDAALPTERLRLAMLGVGARGRGVMAEFAAQPDVRFVAVCDPFRDRREDARSKLRSLYSGGDVDAYASYTDVMARDDIDAVVCCSCDHWHVPLAYAAATTGKDMYVEKPLGPSLGWSRALRRELHEHDCVFQYGTQQRSGAAFRYAAEVVRGGHLGRIERVDAWCIDGTRATEWFDPKSKRPVPVLEGLDYDLWLGPAPDAAYSSYRVHREGSFHTYDYSLGFIAGWGAHPLDTAQWALDTDHTSPVLYEGTGKLPCSGGLFSTVFDWDVRCEYASGVELRFMSHRIAEPVVSTYRERPSDHGTTFFGERGWLSVDRRGLEASDPCLLEIEEPAGDTPLRRSRGHARDFLDAVRERTAPLSPFEAAIRSDTISHLSDLAIRTGRTIRWDPISESVIGDEDANRRLTRPMRAPHDILPLLPARPLAL